MGDTLGKIGNYAVGNFGGRLLGRRMHKDDALKRVLSQQTYQDSTNLTSLQKAQDLSAWAAVLYGLHYGNTPRGSKPRDGSFANSLSIDGWENIFESLDGAEGQFDALAYRRGRRVVVAIEGTTNTGDWKLNGATALNISSEQFEAAWNQGLEIASKLNPGDNVDITGQSLGGALTPIVAAAIESTGENTATIIGFSTPEYKSQVTSFLQSKGWSAAQIADLESRVKNYRFAGDAIDLPGPAETFGENNIIGHFFFEETSTLSGDFEVTLVKDGVRIHASGLISEVLRLLPDGYLENGGDNQSFVLDRFGRLQGFRAGEGPDADSVNGVTDFGAFFNAEGKFYAHAFLPDTVDVRELRLNVAADGTTFVSYYDQETNNTVRLVYQVIDGPDGEIVVALEEVFEPGGKVRKTVMQSTPGEDDGREITGEAASALMAELNTRPFEFGNLFATMGSSLGNFLGGENPLQKVVASSVISTVAMNFGQALDFAGQPLGAQLVESDIQQWFDNVGDELANAFRGATIGSVSSFLSLELGEALGLEGFGLELFNTVSSSVTSRVLENFHQFQFGDLFQGINVQSAIGNVAKVGETVSWNPGFLSSAVGSFLGAKLGAMVVSPQTQAAGILASVGSAAGSYVFGVGAATSGQVGAWAAGLASNLGHLGNVIVPGVGAFLGFVLGALIGNLFGAKPPPPPEADAETVLNFDTGYYDVGQVTSRHGGNESLVRDMASTARDTLNGLIGLVTYDSEIAGNANLTSPTQMYGHTADQMWVRLDTNRNGTIDATESKRNFDSADEAVDYGALWAIRQTKIAGGDMYLKRALYTSQANSIVALSGDLQIAEDYAFYLQNKEIINAAIAAPYESLSEGENLLRGGDLSLGTAILQNHTDYGGGSQGPRMDILDDGEEALVIEDHGFNGDASERFEIWGGDLDGGQHFEVAAGETISWGFDVRRLQNAYSRTSVHLRIYDASGNEIQVANTYNALDQNMDWETRTNSVVAAAGAAYAKLELFTVGRHSNYGPEPDANTISETATRNFFFSRGADGVSDKDFYDQNEDRFTRVMAAPRDENGDLISAETLSLTNDDVGSDGLGDLGWYNRYSARVDAIIDQLSVSQLAAGWIITLQRAAELGLNETQRSDFYGGMAGFVDSLKLLARSDFEYDDVQFRIDGSDLVVDYGRADAETDNILRGGDLSLGAAILQNHTDHGGGSQGPRIQRIEDGSTALVIEDHGFNGDASEKFEIWGGDLDGGQHFEVAAGETISWGFDVRRLQNAYSRTSVHLRIYDASGNEIQVANTYNALDQNMDWETRTNSIVAAAGAAYAKLELFTVGRHSNHGPAPDANTISETATRNFFLTRSEAGEVVSEFGAPITERYIAANFFAGAGYHKMDGSNSISVSNSTLQALYQQVEDLQHYVIQASFTAVTDAASRDTTEGNDYFAIDTATGQSIDDLRYEDVEMSYTYYDAADGQQAPGQGIGDISGTFWIEGGDDIFKGNVGNDEIYGRSGFDWLEGGDGNDIIFGGTEDDIIFGGSGSDQLFGEAGDDYIHVGPGADYREDGTDYGAWGGDGDDTLIADGSRVWLRGEADDDLIILNELTTGWSRYEGGSGSDTLSFERFSTGVDINIGAAGNTSNSVGWQTIFSNQHFVSFENFTATAFDDVLEGDAGDNIIRGLDGDDTLRGGDGDDVLEGGRGADHLQGQGGLDTYSYEGSRSAVWIDWIAGEAFGGDAEGDTFADLNHLRGSAFDDTFTGSDGRNYLWGGRGDDWFVATSGDDRFYGEADFDTVDYSEYIVGVTVNLLSGTGSGGAGGHLYFEVEHIVGTDFADSLTGGAEDNVFQAGQGDDVLNGGDGLDTYIFHRGDGEDTIIEAHDGGWDTLMFGDGISWSDLAFGGNGSDFWFDIKGSTGDRVRVNNNWTGNPGDKSRRAKIDEVDVGGVGAVNIQHLEGVAVGSESSDTGGQTIYGDFFQVDLDNDGVWDQLDQSKADIIFGYAGNDTIEAGGLDRFDGKDNIIIGGLGNDRIYASTGDDTYVFDRGDGFDTITDAGGEDRIQFGPGIAAEDVIFEVDGTHLYIGIRDDENPELSASQVSDKVRVLSYAPNNVRMEFITAGGVDIDLRKLDLNSVSASPAGSGGSGSGGSGSGGSGSGGSGSGDPGNGGSSGNNTPPTAIDDVVDAQTGDFNILQVLSNDSDPDGDGLMIDQVNGQSIATDTPVTLPSGNTVHLTVDNALLFFTDNVGSDSFTYRVTDGNGGNDTGNVLVNITEGNGASGIGSDNNEFLLPILIDLDGDGADLVSISRSRVVFESDSGGPLMRTGWIGADDGFLALDRDGDGAINKLSEISFVNDLPGAETDLEGLQAFDTNSDGVFDANDDQFTDFRIWRDLNQNGFGSSSELFTLAELGIESISLTLTDLGTDLSTYRESGLLNTTVVTYADGGTTLGFDVALNAQLAHIEGNFIGATPESWSDFDRTADGRFGVAHSIDHAGDESELAALQQIEGGSIGADETAPEQDMVLHLDADDSLEAPVLEVNLEDLGYEAFGVQPIIFDMDGDGIETLNPVSSTVFHDANGDGSLDTLGWVAPDDAILALDRNNDGIIQLIDEISFVQDLPGAETDLQGLRAYDDNGDGWLDASDSEFTRFQLWHDRNANGVSEAGEVKSLTEAGIVRLSLDWIEGTARDGGPLGNTLFGEATVVWSNGSERRAGDVELRAFAGSPEADAQLERQREINAGRTQGLWDFDRDFRRDLILDGQEASTEVRSQLPLSRPLLSYDGEQSGYRATETDIQPLQAEVPAFTMERVDVDVGEDQSSVSPARFNPSVGSVSKGHFGDDMFGVVHRRQVTRWWGGHQISTPSWELVEDTLAARLDRLDQGKLDVEPAKGEHRSSLPTEDAERMADRQRLLQAMAAFLGSSGVPAVRRGDRLNDGEENTLATVPNRFGESQFLP